MKIRQRPVWPFRRSHIELNDGNYEHDEDVEPEPLTHQKRARLCANSLIDAEIGVDGDAISD